MKFLFLSIGLTLVLLAPSAQPLTSPYRVEIKCEQKRLDVKRRGSETTESAEESWAYSVTITNHSFKDIPDLRVTYVVFSKHEKSGSKTGGIKPHRTAGSQALGTLANNGKTSFDTEQVTLKKSRLKSDYEYTNGAKSTATDKISGIWLRVYSGSELIDELAQPASLRTQEKWEE